MNRWMNLRRRRRQAPLQLLHYRTCKKERTNERRNERLHGQTAVQAKRANTHMHTLLTLPFLRMCVGERESQSQVYSYNNDACAASSGSGASSSDTLCSRRALKVNWIRRQAPRQRRLRRRLWLNLLDEQLSAEQRRGSTACNSLAFNCLGVASHDHYLSAAQLHYEQRVCVWVRERESAIALQRADDKFVIRKISRWALNYLICLMKMPRANAELCTRSPLPSPPPTHSASIERQAALQSVIYCLYIVCGFSWEYFHLFICLTIFACDSFKWIYECERETEIVCLTWGVLM